MRNEIMFSESTSLDNAKKYKRQSWDSLPIPKCVMCGCLLQKIDGWNRFVCKNGCSDYNGLPLIYVDYRDIRFGIGDFLYAH